MNVSSFLSLKPLFIQGSLHDGRFCFYAWRRRWRCSALAASAPPHKPGLILPHCTFVYTVCCFLDKPFILSQLNQRKEMKEGRDSRPSSIKWECGGGRRQRSSRQQVRRESKCHAAPPVWAAHGRAVLQTTKSKSMSVAIWQERACAASRRAACGGQERNGEGQQTNRVGMGGSSAANETGGRAAAGKSTGVMWGINWAKASTAAPARTGAPALLAQ